MVPSQTFSSLTRPICIAAGFADIIPWDDAHHLMPADEKTITHWEPGSHANCQCDVFKHDNVIVFHLACIAFADLLWEIQFISKKGK